MLHFLIKRALVQVTNIATVHKLCFGATVTLHHGSEKERKQRTVSVKVKINCTHLFLVWGDKYSCTDRVSDNFLV